MNFNIMLQDLSFEPFFNISRHFLFAWTVINFLKCVYVTISISKKRLPPSFVAAIFTGMTVVYLMHIRASIWMVLQLLNLLLIVYTVLATRDTIFLLGLLSITTCYLKLFAFIVDVFAISFMVIDTPAAIFENPPIWSMLYVNCLASAVAMAKMNSHGPALYKFIGNCLYICFFWSITWNATDRMRPIPVFMTTVFYILRQFNRDEPIKFGSPQFVELPSNVLTLDWF